MLGQLKKGCGWSRRQCGCKGTDAVFVKWVMSCHCRSSCACLLICVQSQRDDSMFAVRLEAG